MSADHVKNTVFHNFGVSVKIRSFILKIMVKIHLPDIAGNILRIVGCLISQRRLPEHISAANEANTPGRVWFESLASIVA